MAKTEKDLLDDDRQKINGLELSVECLKNEVRYITKCFFHYRDAMAAANPVGLSDRGVRHDV